MSRVTGWLVAAVAVGLAGAAALAWWMTTRA
jgi:hypothetical protein